jgi:hypothetical protein
MIVVGVLASGGIRAMPLFPRTLDVLVRVPLMTDLGRTKPGGDARKPSEPTG